MKQALFLALFGLMTQNYSAFSQINTSSMEEESSNFEEMFDDEFDNEEKDVYTLRFFDALNGAPLKEGQVEIKDKGTFTTDIEGKVQFPKDGFESGKLLVTFSKNGYISSDFVVEVEISTIFFNRFSISPVLDLGAIRIVLEWDRSPKDLDAHLVKKNSFHISYHDKRTLADGIGQLDIDDQNGFGPETITLNDVDENGTYTYFVNDFTNRMVSNSKNLCKSKAVVRVYSNNMLKYNINVPQDKRGTTWNVFQLVKGNFTIINTIEP